ncbi:MAG: hypothetical protein V3U56_11345 [Syntrophobacteria bacterium]
MQSKEIHRVLNEVFPYVTFDIIRERIIEVKEFGACAGGSRQGAAGSGQKDQQ